MIFQAKMREKGECRVSRPGSTPLMESVVPRFPGVGGLILCFRLIGKIPDQATAHLDDMLELLPIYLCWSIAPHFYSTVTYYLLFRLNP